MLGTNPNILSYSSSLFASSAILIVTLPIMDAGDTTMLTITNTANLAGIEVSGDYADLDALYMALLFIVGDEGQGISGN